MTWLYSIIFAGLMISSDANVPAPTNNVYTEQPVTIVKFDETERFEQTYPLSANGRVSVSNVNGSIAIDTWDRDEVKFVAVKTADTKERLSEVEIRIDSKPEYFSVETDYGDWKRNGNKGWKNNSRLEIEYTLTVPRNASLNEIETVNGSVKIVNAGGNVVKASAVNGEVRASNLRGAASLSSVNGIIEADFDQLQTGSRISLDTVNGTVNLTIPSDANATLRADSVNGAISNDFGLPVRKGKYVGRDLYGKVGTGEVQIRLNSVNGGLTIKRKNDGKNTNPAVNLLPQKSEDDEDWDDDDDSDDDSDSSRAAQAKLNKDIAKAAKDAQKEMKKIEPQIAKATSDAVKLSAESIKEAAKALESDEFKQKIQDAVKSQETLIKMSEIGWIAGAPVIEKKSDSFTVKGTPRVTVDAMNCDVTVRGWDKNEVKYSVTKISRVRSNEPLNLKTANTDSSVNLTVTNTDTPAYKDLYNKDLSRVVVEVYVPKKSNLKIVTNREIRLEGVSGELDLSGSEGAINVRDSDGKLRVNSECGKIRVIGFRGEVDSKTDSGTVSLEGEFTKITGTSDSGAFILTLSETANADVHANVKDSVTIENMPASKEVSEGNWRFGKGGAKYNFTVDSGQILVRNASVLQAE